MDHLAGIFFTSFLIGLSGALMPGPVLTVTISQVASRGFWAGPLIVLGHGILELSLVAAVALGLGRILTLGPVIGTIAIVGGIFLVYLGYDILRSLKGLSLSLQARAGGRKIVDHPVMAGILTSLSNPYWTIWWATIGLGYIALSRQLGRIGHRIEPEHADPAGLRPQQTEHVPKQRRLAGAVDADQPKNRASRHAETRVVQRGRRAESSGHPFDLDDRLGIQFAAVSHRVTPAWRRAASPRFGDGSVQAPGRWSRPFAGPRPATHRRAR